MSDKPPPPRPMPPYQRVVKALAIAKSAATELVRRDVKFLDAVKVKWREAERRAADAGRLAGHLRESRDWWRDECGRAVREGARAERLAFLAGLGAGFAVATIAGLVGVAVWARMFGG